MSTFFTVALRAREARALLSAGRAREAVDRLERLLLLERDSADLKLLLEQARIALGEQSRRAESLLDEAERSLEAGDPESAQVLLSSAEAQEGDPLRRGALRDRLDSRRGGASWFGASTTWLEPHRHSSPEPRPNEWSRRALGLGWAAALTLGLFAASTGWDRFVESLVQPPHPRSRALPPPSLARQSTPPPAPRAALAGAGRPSKVVGGP